MPAGRFSEVEIAATLRRTRECLDANKREYDHDERLLKLALTFVKRYITEEQTPLNEDLHNAVQIFVDFARKHGHLKR